MRVPADFTVGLRFPPLWFAVALAVGLVSVTNSTPGLCPLYAPITIGWDSFTGPLIAIFAAALLWPKRRPWQRRTGPSAEAATADVTEWPALVAWAEREMPAGPHQPDLFGHAEIARRIAQRLCRPWGADETIALLGPYGSGKTTLLNWLRADLETARNPTVWLCQVNAWGLERSSTAPTYVLSRILDMIDQMVDCQPLQGLPAAYQQILSADPTGVAQRVAALVSPPDDAIEALQKLTPILKASNARLVLLVEDIDRAGPDFHPEHVLRLLWNLRHVEGVSFVLAFDPRREDLEYSKLCDHVELLPRLDTDAVRRPLRLLLDYCRSTPPNATPLIDPVQDDDRGDPLDLHDAQSPLEVYARRAYRNTPADALGVLLTTPRMLKHVVRRSRRVWDALRGEIDVYDVILVTALREGAPAAYEFLVANMDAIRKSRSGNLHGLADAEEGKALLDRWKTLRGDDAKGEATQAIVDALAFPRLSAATRSPHIQGIAGNGATDYFRRLLAEELGKGEVRDQSVLADIDAYVRGDKARMAAALVDATEDSMHYVEIWEHFAKSMPAERLQPLAAELVAAIMKRDGQAATGKHPALLAAWRQCGRRLFQGPERVDWLANLVRATSSVSLHLANDLYYFWTSAQHGLVDQEGRKQVRAVLVAAAQSQYVSSAALASVLNLRHAWNIRELVCPNDNAAIASDVIDPPQWAWLAQPLLDGLNVDTAQFLPEVVNLVGDFGTNFRATRVAALEREETYSLNRDRITGIFGQRTNDLLRLLADSQAEYWAAAEAKRQASAWLSEEDHGS
jgi:hypothetical protein